MENKTKQSNRIRRHRRVRAKIKGTAKRPRLNIYRSNTGIYAQLIDDEAGKTLVSASTKEIKGKKGKAGSKVDVNLELGKL